MKKYLKNIKNEKNKININRPHASRKNSNNN